MSLVTSAATARNALGFGAWSVTGAWNLGFGALNGFSSLRLDIFCFSFFALRVHSSHATLAAELRSAGKCLSFDARCRTADRGAADRHRVFSHSNPPFGAAWAGGGAGRRAVGLSHAAPGRGCHDPLRRPLRPFSHWLDHPQPDFPLSTHGEERALPNTAQQSRLLRTRSARAGDPDRVFVRRIF